MPEENPLAALLCLGQPYWNGWVSQVVRSIDKDSMIKAGLVSENDFRPLSSIMQGELYSQLKQELPSKSAAVRISNHNFRGRVNAVKSIFPVSVNFDDCSFESSIDFKFASFGSIFQFNECIFYDFADFSNAKFGGQVLFKDCHFKKGVSFRSSVFEFDGSGSDDRFIDTVFHGTVYIWSAVMRRGIFRKNCLFKDEVFFTETDFAERVRFPNTEFNGSTTFEGATFRTWPPELYNTELHEDTKWLRANWPPRPSKADADDHLRAYQRLKMTMDTLKKLDDEQFFHSRELECREVLDGSPKNVPSIMYGILSDYGRSIIRPFKCLVATFCLGVIFTMPFLWHWRVSWWFLQAIIFSISNTFGFLGLNRSLNSDISRLLASNIVTQMVVTSQVILGPIFLFLLLLAIRNRYRMR
jgi:hypothetical protein